MNKKPSHLPVKIIFLLVILVIPLNVLSLVVSSVMIRDAKNAIISSIYSTVNTYTDNIDQIVYNANSILYELNERDINFLTLLIEDDNLEYQIAKSGLKKTIRDNLALTSTADYFYTYREDLDDLFIIPHNDSSLDHFLYSNNYFSENQIEHSQWHLVKINDINYLAKLASNGTLYYGAFICLDNITSSIDTYLNYPVQEIIYTENHSYKPEHASTSDHILTVSVPCNRTDLYLNLTFDHSVLTSSISSWRWFLIIIVGLYIVLVPLLYHYIRKWVLTPLTELNTAHHHLEQGEEQYRITRLSNSAEFGQVYTSFNRMAESLQNLRLEKINNELARKQMMLDNLQLQIRPHFLLNTFNLLYSMIQTKKVEPALEMILYLSQYFRYLFQYNRELELFTKEWELVQQYLRVSRFQHPDAFTFNYELDPEISLVRIPPLLLHNFFENILSHALIHGQVIHIMFSGFYDNGTVTFQIADDGRGMPDEEVELINSGNYDEYRRGLHVGLRNSITRIKYFYNQQGTIHADSTLNEGTIFTITFPYNLEEDPEYEAFDGK